MNPTKDLSVLVVDDDPVVRLSLVGYLEERDYRVQEAADGEEALAYIKETPFDVAIVDIRLPGINGEQLIPKIRASDARTYFLVVTGSVQYVLPPALREIGVTDEDVFQKPLPDLKVIVERIEDRVGHDTGRGLPT